MDQPTMDGINVYAISRAVRQTGIKVVLSGQGGDEVFGGYPAFGSVPKILSVQSALRHLPAALRSGAAGLADVLLRQRWIGSKAAQLIRSDPDMLTSYLTFRQLFNPRSRERLLLNRDTSGMINGIPVEIEEEMNAEIRGLDAFRCLSILEMRLFMANTLLRDGDFMSMAHGLEIRVPFLDHRIVEFVFSVEPQAKSVRGTPKPLLVQAMGDLLPREIWQRPKMGFMFPWDLWLRHRLRPQIEQTLDKFPDDNGLGLRMSYCRAVWREFLAGTRGVTWPRVWALYVLLSWCRRNLDVR
jgi:asparagine synthase (glutamine-hydrolysing)